MYVLKSFLWHREIAPRAKTADWHTQNSRRVRVLAFALFLLSAPHSSHLARKTHLPPSLSHSEGEARGRASPGISAARGACGLPGGHSFFERLLSGPVRSSELGRVRRVPPSAASRSVADMFAVVARRGSGQRRAQRRVPCRARPRVGRGGPPWGRSRRPCRVTLGRARGPRRARRSPPHAAGCSIPASHVRLRRMPFARSC